VYAEVLGVERVGLDDDFFALGGHSLKAVRAMHMISESEELDLKLEEFFARRTPRSLSLGIRTDNRIGNNLIHKDAKEIFEL
ncbi:phosphopantetheine-binding protein, partial [Pelagicoccus sp. SDUM812002]|uniref:phosphopantetheine-binding protein n=1 Tax=Pelagicoccus sp. SDUM812002 TaxID=3041266 RepID=UPI00280DC030